MGFKIDRITRILESRGFHAGGLQVDELVELHMANSSIEQLWYGCKQLKTPYLTGILNLESLILEGCTSLSEVHPSLARHKKLQYVNLVNCVSIRILPNNLEMESLKVFTLDDCSKLEKFPDIVGNMNCLMVLCLDETGITKISSSIHHLIGLGLLSMNSCKNFKSIPSSIGCLKSLKKLDLSSCSELKCLPENLGKVESLEEFDVSGTSIRQLPASVFLSKKLKVLSLDGCKRIVVLPFLTGLCSLEILGLRSWNLREGALPEDIGWLSSLRSLDMSQNNSVSLPKNIMRLFELEMLVLEDCTMLESLPQVPYKVQMGWSNPRPGFGIAVPGNEIPGWFNHQINGRENYPSPMSISCNSIQVLSDHIWLFFLSFDYLKELKEWKNETFSNIELSFHSYKQRVKVKNCGVCLLSSRYR
ncbi:hypothetical protein POTOM_050219 [Populus tomentosa]|uniref:Disease resistance protein RPS4B/Roq1-like leucine-rich repeats domain-containing protein n=1 Tax=Populus tomentosa TaxID=118781 RepID=A0A8X8C224_POPTO|nr:hypothetical protein POTOM_050219 [Populus tomentosa]